MQDHPPSRDAGSELDPAAKPARPPIPWVCGALILASVSVFGAERALHVDAPELGALFGPLVAAGQWWRLLSYGVVHAGLLHLGVNMFMTVSLGVPIERRLGSVRFLQTTLVAGLGGAAFPLIFAPKNPVVGASAIIFGWAGAIVPLLDRRNVRQFGSWLLLNLLFSLLPGISLAGHLGGFVFGLGCGALLRWQAPRFSMLAPLLAALAGGAALIAAYRGG